MRPFVLSIINHKGGSAKTTTCEQLVDLIISDGFSALVIDFDTSCNATNFYEAVSKKDIIDFLKGDKKAIINIKPNLSIVCGSQRIKDFDSIFFSEKDIYAVIKNAIYGLQYDFIIIDTPHAIGRIIQNTIISSDAIIMPVMPSRDSGDGTIDVMAEIEKLKKSSKRTDIENCTAALLPAGISLLSAHDRRFVSVLKQAHANVEMLPAIPYKRSIMHDQSERVIKNDKIRKAYRKVYKWLLNLKNEAK